MTRGIHPNVNAGAIARLWYSGRPAGAALYTSFFFELQAKFCFGKNGGLDGENIIRAGKYTGEVDLEMIKIKGGGGTGKKNTI